MPVDELTSLPSPRAFQERVDAALRAMAAHEGRAALLRFDIDRLAAINQAHGRWVGDAVLVELAGLLRALLRETDVVGRVGDDELAVLALDCSLEQGVDIAERVARAASSHGVAPTDGGTLARVTLSGGVAAWPEHGGDAAELLAAAGRAVSQAKSRGGDGVGGARHPGSQQPPATLAVDRFVGRDSDSERLRRHFDAALAGDPSIVVVTGEAGVGKTSLVRQLEATARLRGGSLVVGTCAEGDVRAPFAAWGHAISAVARLGGVARRDWQELPQLVPALGRGDIRGIRGDKYALFEESATFLHAAASAHPLVVVIDDAQWADTGTWDMLEYLAPTLSSERILIVVILRSDASREAHNHARRILNASRVHQIRLERLTRDEVQRWLTAAFHGQDAGHELLGFLYAHTEGNPLFVVQALRALADEGALWHDGAQWRWRPVADLELPGAVDDLIIRRMARLSARTREVLAGCAVIGREFDIELAGAAEIGRADALQAAVDEGVRAGILQATAMRLGERYAFHHVSIGAMLRAALPARRLREIHARVAAAIEQRTPDAAAEIAAHYDRAGASREAFRCALRAGDQAVAVYAQSEAMGYLRIAARHAESDDERAEVSERFAQAEEIVGAYETSLAHAERALAHFARAGEVRRSLGLRRLILRVRLRLGAPALDTLAECERIAADAAAAEADDERAHALGMMSRLHARLGDAPSAVRTAAECAAIAEDVGDDRLLADAVTRLGVCLEPDQPDRAVEHYWRGLELYRMLGDPRGQAHCHNNLGIVFARRGEIDIAERELTTAITLGRAIGAPDLSGLFTLNLGVVILKRGEFDRARDLIGESLAQFGAVKNSERQLFALLNLAHLDRERGDWATAAELYEAAESLARRIGQDDVEIGAIAGRALALAALGNAGEARPVAAAAVARSDRRNDWFQGRELAEVLAVRALCDAGRRDEALDRFERNLPLAEAADLYGAAWLTIEVGRELAAADRTFVHATVARFGRLTRENGYLVLADRCKELIDAFGEDRAHVA